MLWVSKPPRTWLRGLLAVPFLLIGAVAADANDELGERFARLEAAGCTAPEVRFCQTPADASSCLPVVISGTASDACDALDAEAIAATCGSPGADLYDDPAACGSIIQMGVEPPAEVEPITRTADGCPATPADITYEDRWILHRCTNLQPVMCDQLCGPRYNWIDVRNFWQTNGHPGPGCFDGSYADMRNGMAYDADPMREYCREIHGGGTDPDGNKRHWCVTPPKPFLNKAGETVDFGWTDPQGRYGWVQCVGKLKPGHQSTVDRNWQDYHDASNPMTLN